MQNAPRGRLFLHFDVKLVQTEAKDPLRSDFGIMETMRRPQLRCEPGDMVLEVVLRWNQEEGTFVRLDLVFTTQRAPLGQWQIRTWQTTIMGLEWHKCAREESAW